MKNQQMPIPKSGSALFNDLEGLGAAARQNY
jgi:hypothetical protein